MYITVMSKIIIFLGDSIFTTDLVLDCWFVFFLLDYIWVLQYTSLLSFHWLLVKYSLRVWCNCWDILGTIRLWSWSIILRLRIKIYLTCWYKIALKMRISWWFSLILYVKISRQWQKYRRIYYILSGWSNWPRNTYSRSSFSVNCINWVQCIMHCMNVFSSFHHSNSWIVEQGSKYSSRGITYNYIG